MKRCPKCQREMPDYATRCPYTDCGWIMNAQFALPPRPFENKIPAAPPISEPSDSKHTAGFAGTIPAAPPISEPSDSKPATGFSGTIPAAPPISEPSDSKHTAGFAGTIPAAPPISAPSDSKHAAGFAGTIPAAPPISAPSDSKHAAGFAGIIPAAPPISAPSDSKPATGFAGTIPAAPPISAPSDSKHAAGFAGTIPAAPPIFAPSDSKPTTGFAGTIPAAPPISAPSDSKHAAGFAGIIPAAPPISEPSDSKHTAGFAGTIPAAPPIFAPSDSKPTTGFAGTIPAAPPISAPSDSKHAAGFSGTIPAAPPISAPSDSKHAAGFAGTIPAAPPISAPSDSKPATGFSGTIPAAPPISEPSDSKHAAGFAGTIPAAPPISAPSDSKHAAGFAGTIPAAPPISEPSDSKHAAGFAGTIPAAPPISDDATEVPSNEKHSPYDYRGKFHSAPILPASEPTQTSSPDAKRVEPPVVGTLPNGKRVEPPVVGTVASSEKRIEPSVVGTLPNGKRVEPPVVGTVAPSEKRTEPPVVGTLPNGKRVEPPVVGTVTSSEKRTEPPVVGVMPNGKRVEPPVVGTVASSEKRTEPPVVGVMPNGKRVEPPVVGTVASSEKRIEPPVVGVMQNGKRVEPPVVGSVLANGKRVEPPVRRAEPPVLMSPGLLGMVFVPSNNYLFQSTSAILPELRGDETQEELNLRSELTNLHFEAKRRFKKSRRLANASLFVMLLTIVAGLWCYYEMVWSYATVSSQPIVSRDPQEPDRIQLTYVPETEGRFSVSYADARCETTIQEVLQPKQIGEPQPFRWRIRELKDEDHIALTYRQDFLLTRPLFTIGKVEFASHSGAASPTGCQLSGVICDATTGEPIPGVAVRIPGKTNTVTKEDGTFELHDFPEGIQEFEATANGYISYRFKSESSLTPVRILLSPGLSEGQIRVVLSWDAQPEDLDAHMEGPLPEGKKFHISYGNLGNVNKQFVTLDIDDNDGFGPETITVQGVEPGTYRYYVHDYSHQSEVATTHLANSQAVVRIYYGNQVLATFTPKLEKVGNLWNVCEIQISEDRQATVKELGDFDDQGVQAMGLYEKRTQENRLAWIADYGGSEETEDSARLALEWLARHQCRSRKFKDSRYDSYYGAWGRFCLDPVVEKDGKMHKNPRCRCDYPEDLDLETTRPDETLPENLSLTEPEHSTAQEAGPLLCLRDEDLGRPDFTVAMTGLSILAFQAGGNYYFNEHDFSRNVKLGLDWLVRFQREDGAFLSHNSDGTTMIYDQFMYEHAIATFALAEACAVAKVMKKEDSEEYKKYRKAMFRAVNFILDAQYADGGWRYTLPPKNATAHALAMRGDTSVTGWVVLALKSAREAGFAIKPAVISKIGKFYSLHTKGNETYYQVERDDKGRITWNKGSSEALTGIGMLVRQFLLEEPTDPYVEKAAARLSKFASKEWKKGKNSEPDFYTWYKCSLALQQYGGDEWEDWNSIVSQELIRLQRHGDDCLKGSWDPEDRWGGHGGGRIYATALGALTLQVYYRYTTQRERSAQLQSLRAPQTQTPERAQKSEAPESEAQKSEAQKSEAQKSETPKSETSKSETSKSETPKSETQKSEAPKSEESKTK